MSRSFTTRPAVTRQDRGGALNPGGRGRGAANVNRGGGARARTSEIPSTSTQPPQQPEDPAERVQRRDAYTVIRPDEKKRQKIAEKAKAEEEAYNKYKEQKKPGRVSYVGTVGGGLMDETTARQQSQQQNKRAVATKGRGGFQQHRDTMKQREQQEIDKKKAEQRRKAEQNKTKDADRQKSLAAQHRAQNAAFLDRLEQQQGKKVRSSSSAAAAAAASPGQDTHSSFIQPDDGSANLDTLVEEFPFYERDMLKDILMQAGGDVNTARNLLQD